MRGVPPAKGLGSEFDHVLLDEGVTFSEWLRRQIDAYLKEKGPKKKPRVVRKVRKEG
jgi:hypothetical protein